MGGRELGGLGTWNPASERPLWGELLKGWSLPATVWWQLDVSPLPSLPLKKLWCLPLRPRRPPPPAIFSLFQWWGAGSFMLCSS